MPNNTITRANLSNNGAIRNIHYGDVLIKFGSVLSIRSDDIPFIKNTDTVNNNVFLKNGDIVIADTAEDETVGKVTEIFDIYTEKVVSGLHTIPCRPKKNFAPKFLGYYMNSPAYHYQLFPLMQGVKVLSISKSNIVSTVIHYPDILQQTKITNLLSLIDKKISVQRQLVEALKKYKRGSLSALFPKKREITPQYRFAGFTKPWEQRKFKDLGSVAMCKRIFKEQTSSEGDIPFYKIGTFGAEADAFISRELYEEYKRKFQYPEIGDMLISASGTIGRTVEYMGEDAYFQDSNIVWFKHDNRIDNSFLKCVYSIVRWSGIEGSTIKRLYNDNFLKTEFYMPILAEQEKIGEYFNTIDHLITLHQHKYDILLSLKNALLQQMFI